MASDLSAIGQTDAIILICGTEMTRKYCKPFKVDISRIIGEVVLVILK